MELLDTDFRIATIPQAIKLDNIYTWGDEERVYDYLKASISHHGTPAPDERSPDASKPFWKPHPQYNPIQAAEQLGHALAIWFPAAFAETQDKLPDNPRFIHLFAGLVSLSDWIGSDKECFKYVYPFDPNYIQLAKVRAQAIVRDIGLNIEPQHKQHIAPVTFQDLTAPNSHPYPHQQAIDCASVEDRLVILEAETGSGKTEAALLRFIRLWEARQVDSLYFAVPTRAAAAQLHERVNRALTSILNTEAILAVPGYMKAGETKGHPLPGYQVLWDDSATASPEKLARRWAAESSKRYLAAQIAVGTVDQAMLAALPVKHAHLRAASLSRSLLVIDEVHASDPYMTGIQSGLLDMHLGVGGHALLMSATLGDRARAKWLNRRQMPLDEAIACPYPAIWTHSDNVDMPADKTPLQKSVAMDLQSVSTAADGLDAAIAAAEKGGKVLVIRNTVKLAIETLNALEAANVIPNHLFDVNGIPTLHHGRFAPEDRQLLDKAVETALGKGRPAGGKIIVGTQTLEQSLDIDADLLITDLCPADVLLQRIGRLYRHRHERPLPQPRCLVLVPEGGLEQCLTPSLRMINGLGGYEGGKILSGIYTDLVTLEATRRLIEAHPLWEIPKMNRFLVESATHPEAHEKLLRELPPAWTTYEHKLFGTESAKAHAANTIRLNPKTFFGELTFPSDEESIRTRLGGGGISIEFDAPPLGPFGSPITKLTLPEHWSTGLNPEEKPKDITAENCRFHFTFSGQPFSYGRLGLEKRKES